MGYEWCDAYVAVDGTEGKTFYGLLMQVGVQARDPVVLTAC